MSDLRSVTVYCGSNAGADPAYAEATRSLARLLVDSDVRIVYGGASLGLMGVLADTALEAGGDVIGIMPQALIDREIGHPGLTGMHIVGSMHERKAMMAELSEGFIALPGGAGTLEELIEMFPWQQLGMHRKPIGVLNVNGYYDSLAAFLDEAVRERFLPAQHREVLIFEPDPETLLDRMAGAETPTAEKWLTEAET